MSETNDNLGTSAVSEGDVTSEMTTPSQAVSEATATAEGNSAPILGKFKSTEDLAKAYQELEGKLGETSSAVEEAKLLREMAEEEGVTVEEIKRQRAEARKAKEMEAAGTNDPAVYELKQQVEALKNAQKSQSFEAEFEKVVKDYPALASVKGDLKTLFQSGDRTVRSIVESMYAPVLQQTEESVVAKLSEKEASNALRPSGNVQQALSDQQVSELEKQALRSNSAHNIAALMAAKRNRK